MTTEREAAENELDETIRRLAPALGIVEDDHLITTWILVGHSVMASEPDRSSYWHAFPGVVPSHVTVGLLRMAQTSLERTGWDDEDDEP
jgi:hypothetical protein